MSEPWHCVYRLSCSADDHRREYLFAKNLTVDRSNVDMLMLAARLRANHRIAKTSFMFLSGSFVADGKYIPYKYAETAAEMPVEEDRPRLRHIMLTDYIEPEVFPWFIDWVGRVGVFHGREVVSSSYMLGVHGGNFYEVVDGVIKLSDDSLVALAYVDVRTSVHRGYSKVENYLRMGFDYVYLVHPMVRERIHREVAQRLAEELPEAGYLVIVPDDYIVYIYKIANYNNRVGNYSFRKLVESRLLI